MKQGIEQGIKQGVRQRIAIEMLKLKIPIDKIEKATGVSKEELKKLL